mmetsp:Transcript_11796/g.37831  ORF Transcript_11796/g.37831 Transcript_11796/m.37831 type:complete len:309 (-) Transcript_11796:326-1252(-)
MSKPLNSPTRADNGMSNFNARTHSSRLAKGRSQRHSGSSAFCTSRSVRRCVRQSSAKRPGNSESWATASCMSSSLIIMGVFGHRRRNCFSTPALRTSTLARPPLPLCDQLPSGGIMRNGLIAASRTSFGATLGGRGHGQPPEAPGAAETDFGAAADVLEAEVLQLARGPIPAVRDGSGPIEVCHGDPQALDLVLDKSPVQSVLRLSLARVRLTIDVLLGHLKFRCSELGRRQDAAPAAPWPRRRGARGRGGWVRVRVGRIMVLGRIQGRTGGLLLIPQVLRFCGGDPHRRRQEAVVFTRERCGRVLML